MVLVLLIWGKLVRHSVWISFRLADDRFGFASPFVLCGTLQIAFALSFYSLLYGNEGFETIWASMVSMFVMSMGEFSLPFSENM